MGFVNMPVYRTSSVLSWNHEDMMTRKGGHFMNPIGFNPFNKHIGKSGERKPEIKADAEIKPTIV